MRKDAHMLGKRLDYQVEENKIHFFFEKEELLFAGIDCFLYKRYGIDAAVGL